MRTRNKLAAAACPIAIPLGGDGGPSTLQPATHPVSPSFPAQVATHGHVKRQADGVQGAKAATTQSRVAVRRGGIMGGRVVTRAPFCPNLLPHLDPSSPAIGWHGIRGQDLLRGRGWARPAKTVPKRSRRGSWLREWLGTAIAIPWSVTALATMNNPSGKSKNGQVRATREVIVNVGQMSTDVSASNVKERECGALSLVSLLPPSLLPPTTRPPADLPSLVSPPLGLLGVVTHLAGSTHPTPTQSRHNAAIVVDVRAKLVTTIRSGTPTPMDFVVHHAASRGLHFA